MSNVPFEQIEPRVGASSPGHFIGLLLIAAAKHRWHGFPNIVSFFLRANTSMQQSRKSRGKDVELSRKHLFFPGPIEEVSSFSIQDRSSLVFGISLYLLL